MKRLFVPLLLLLSVSLFAQSENYSRVKIYLQGRPVSDLAKLGLDVEHGMHIKYRWLISDFSESEIQLIGNKGFDYDIVIQDVKAHYVSQNDAPAPYKKRAVNCDVEELSYPTPANFSLGSFAGYFTYQEMLDELDAMATLYPNLISPRAAIDSNNLTHENRMIYWVRLSDNPTVDENEPEALYTAIHHAREPGGLSQTIFYLWYMLENYATNPEIKYLIDNTELYFVPCVNPDGYIYNEINDPNGGGLWRKNMRNNGDGTFGVDLNRNYGLAWGIDNTGSSPSTNSETYRGTSGFSEPETQNVRDFCQQHNFQIALNYHTYGNLLIHPWGYNDQQTPDSTTFRGFANFMTRENNYVAGTGTETVGYITNGDSDDWMYGDNSKPKMFTFTPEAGPSNEGFWPPSSSIVRICTENVHQNLALPRLLLNFGEVSETNGPLIASTNGNVDFELTRLGLTAGQLEVSITPISTNIQSVGTSKTFNLQQFEKTNDSISYVLDPSIQFGDNVVFLLNLNNGVTTFSDTISKIYQAIDPIFADAGNDASNWQNSSSDNWQVTTLDYVTAPSSFTDSPFGDYSDNNISELITLDPISISDTAQVAILQFWAKWDIEAEYDYVQVLASVNGNNYTPLCGKYSKPGTRNQDEDEPVWDGKQDDWVLEEVNLIDYVGQSIYIKFHLVSDAFETGDGFYMDDIEVLSILGDTTTTPIDTTGPIDTTVGLDILDFDLGYNYPNPASNFTIIKIAPTSESTQLQVVNAIGQIILTRNIEQAKTTEVYVDTRSWAPGIYHYHITSGDRSTRGRPMVISR